METRPQPLGIARTATAAESRGPVGMVRSARAPQPLDPMLGSWVGHEQPHKVEVSLVDRQSMISAQEALDACARQTVESFLTLLVFARCFPKRTLRTAPSMSGIAVSAASRALGPPLGRIAGHGAHVRGNGELQEL
jgi:hypothetical protein